MSAQTSEVNLWQSTMPKVVARAWSDPAFEQQLQSNPGAALAQFGLDVPSDLEIRVETGSGSPQQWQMLNENGRPVWVLPIPPKPASVNAQHLTNLAAGAQATDGVTICCSICCCCQ